VNALIILKSRN